MPRLGLPFSHLELKTIPDRRRPSGVSAAGLSEPEWALQPWEGNPDTP